MKTLPANLVLDKNILYDDQPWLFLLQVTIPSDPAVTVYLVRNTEDITFQGQLYQKFPFEIDIPMKETSKGELPSITLRVSNVDRMMQGYLELYDGLIGQSVKLLIVKADRLAEDYSELTLDFLVNACYSDVEWVTFTLGAPNPLVKRFPLYKYFSSVCCWKSQFKGIECKYAGVATTCRGTLDDCRSKNNSVNFGGFVGLEKHGLRVV